MIKETDQILQHKIVNNILTKCETVICFRTTPEEKAQLIHLVKTHHKVVCLAVGDGSNDVNMLMEANIGVALDSKDSQRAIQSANYVVPEFRHIWKLMFVHGRWNYIRLAELIIFMFYKNMIFTMPQIMFCFLNAYSGQTLFGDWYISMYNLFFTTIPVVIRAIFDKDVYYKQWNHMSTRK